MKTRLLLLAILTFSLTSCRFEHKVIEETYPDGSAKRVCIYKGSGEGRELVKETKYYSNKQPYMEGTYKDNLRDGIWFSWREDGKLWSECAYVKDKKSGKIKVCFENGKVFYEGFFQEDIRVGKWRFYDEKGVLQKEYDYSSGNSK